MPRLGKSNFCPGSHRWTSRCYCPWFTQAPLGPARSPSQSEVSEAWGSGVLGMEQHQGKEEPDRTGIRWFLDIGRFYITDSGTHKITEEAKQALSFWKIPNSDAKNTEQDLEAFRWGAADTRLVADVYLNNDGRFDCTSTAKNTPPRLQVTVAEKQERI